MILKALAQKWWVIVLQGVAAVVFGVLALIRPGATLAALILVMGFWFLADGILALFGMFVAADESEPWWMWLVHALVSVGVGLVILRWPGVTGLALLLLIAFWAILRGLVTIAGAIALRRELEGEFWYILAGIISVVFGVWITISPAAEGALAVIWLIGLYALAFGIALILAGMRLRSVATAAPRTAAR
jgi:uncharacterized membrane protein HdeD (DUF308 family)